MANALWIAPSVNGQWAPSSRATEYYRRTVTSRPSLVGLWRLDPPTGTTDFDQSGNVNTNTLSGGFTLNQPTVLVDNDWATLLDGASGVGTIADAASLHVADLFTIECWLQRSSIGLGASVNLFSAPAGSNAQTIQIDTGDHILCNKRGAGTIMTSTVTISDTTVWHHLVWTKNGATNTLYLDGVNITPAVSNLTMASTAGGYIIGGAPASPFPGKMASVALYNVALTAAQVAADFRVGRGQVGVIGQQT